MHFRIEPGEHHTILRLISRDDTNRLTRARVLALTEAVESLREESKPLILAGNARFFSAGADLNAIAELTGADAFTFARMGQRLMQVIADFPARTVAAIEGYCMGGGLDLALACDHRIAAPSAIFGHRGAALGIMTGWGGTQRLPRLIGKSNALHLFCAAEKVSAEAALRIGLVDQISNTPLDSAVALLSTK